MHCMAEFIERGRISVHGIATKLIDLNYKMEWIDLIDKLLRNVGLKRQKLI